MKKQFFLLLAMASNLLAATSTENPVDAFTAQQNARAAAAVSRIKYINAAKSGDVQARLEALAAHPDLLGDVVVYIEAYENGHKDSILAQVAEDQKLVEIGIKSARDQLSWGQWVNQEWKSMSALAGLCIGSTVAVMRLLAQGTGSTN